jgi:signal transduction histidine kinase
MTLPGDDDKRREVERRLGELARQQDELVQRLEAGQRYFQQLARSVWRVQEDERRRLARELHDGIGQNLTALLHLLRRARDALDGDREVVRNVLDRGHGLAASTLEDTRALSRLLRPQILDDLGLEPALRWLVRTFAETHGIDVRLDLEQPLPPLDADRSTLVFRAVQESLTNVARHADAHRVDVSLRRQDDRVRLRIEDDGRGCESSGAASAGADGRGSGIGGMRDRVRLFSGRFSIDSAPGRGFSVMIDFPCEPDGGDTR